MSESGFIYAIGVPGAACVKIGSTHVAVSKRLASLQTGHPSRLQVLAAVAVERDVRQIERTIHQCLEAERQHGEWFAIEIDQPQLEALVAKAIPQKQLPEI